MERKNLKEEGKVPPTKGAMSQPHFGAKCENATHTPESGKMESFGSFENSEFDLRGQISLHLSVIGLIEKVLKCRCPKWPQI
jgi:hypothetical protein